MKHHIVYVPGLGDNRSYGQPYLLNLWRLFGLTPHYHRFGWADGEGFEPKLRRLLQIIDALKTTENKVSLVGVSAGASAVLTAYKSRTNKITGVICISGKINNGQTIGPGTFSRNPAFRSSIAGLPDVLQSLTPGERRRIMSIHPVKDETVPPADTIILGAKEKKVWAFSHVQSIFYCLAFSGSAIASFLKNL